MVSYRKHRVISNLRLLVKHKGSATQFLKITIFSPNLQVFTVLLFRLYGYSYNIHQFNFSRFGDTLL